MKDLNDIIKDKNYNFLLNDEGRFNKDICILGYGGSHAYGTNVEDSDIDIRGVILDRNNNILGIKDNFEQIEDKTTDTVIYTMSKVYSLLTKCNPNVIEMLGLRPRDYLYVDEIGQLLLDNKHIFLSKQAYNKFYGYAKGQLNRLENALVNRANNKLSSEADAEKILTHRIKTKISEYKRRYDGFDVEVYTDNGKVDLKYTFINMEKKKINHIINELNSIVESLNSLGKRAGRAINKGELQIGKHAMHLVRLYYMCIDILTNREIITYRENERELLLEIRNGHMQKPNGNFKPEFYTLLKELEDKMNTALINSKLPDKPNIKTLNNLKEEITIKTLKRRMVV